MKRLFVFLLSVLILISTLFSLLGCASMVPPGGETSVVIDPNKKQVYVSLFSGGFGDAWLQEAARKFNEANPKTQVVIDANRDNWSVISGELQSGLADDVYFTNDTLCQLYARQGLLEPMSDVWDMIPAEGETQTVREKMIDAADFSAAYTLNGEEYGLPISEGLHGWIYDRDLCTGNNGQGEVLLITDESGNLSAGKDGKTGTWDDGLPVDLKEWDLMIQKMVASGIYPFSWSGAAASDYLIPLGETVFAQYEGLDNYRIASLYKGTYVDPVTKQETVITPQEGYKTYSLMKGRQVAAEFMSKYLFGNSLYYTPNSTKTGTTYLLAHDYFILGYKNAASNPRAAMMYEGVWWENESRTTFNSCKEEGYGYGERDFAFMPLPAFENQLGANGDGTGSVVAVSENGTAFISKQEDPEVLDAAKRFIAYTCSDEMLRYYTAHTGAVKPYKYTLTESDLQSMTKFGRHVWEMYSDYDNIKLARYQILNAASPMIQLASPSAGRWNSKIDGKISPTLFSAMDSGVSPAKYFEGLSNYNDSATWANIYNQVKELYE